MKHSPGVAVLFGAMLLGGCGGAAQQSTSGTNAIPVAAGAGCAADHRQDLSFSGALTGHLVCATGEPVCNFIAVGSGQSGFDVVINGVAGGKSLQVGFAVNGFSGPGSYASDNQEGGTSITLDGPVHWQGHLGDAVTITTADDKILTGRVDSTLSDGATPSVRLSGTWVCDRIKAPS